MPGIRAFVEDDIPEVARLFERILFKARLQESAYEYYREVFLDNPWYDPELPSLVYEAKAGEIVAFVGVVVRPMSYRGEPIRAAVLTQFMVAPEWRDRLIGVHILNRVFRGPQDLSLADNAGSLGRGVWVGCGGFVSILHSLYWTRPLRPFEYARRVALDRGHRTLAHLLHPVGILADVAATRSRGYFHQGPPRLSGEDVNRDELARQQGAVTSSRALVPADGERALAWLLAMAQREKRWGELQMVVARDEAGKVAGCYSYYLARDKLSEVVCVRGEGAITEDLHAHMSHHAWTRGAIGLHGRFDRAMLELSKRPAFRRDGPWTIVHSRRAELVEAFHTDDVQLSRLDGEWWIDFTRFRAQSSGLA